MGVTPTLKIILLQGSSCSAAAPSEILSVDLLILYSALPREGRLLQETQDA